MSLLTRTLCDNQQQQSCIWTKSQEIVFVVDQRAKVRPKRAGKKTKTILNCKLNFRECLLVFEAALAIAPRVSDSEVDSGNGADIEEL